MEKNAVCAHCQLRTNLDQDGLCSKCACQHAIFCGHAHALKIGEKLEGAYQLRRINVHALSYDQAARHWSVSWSEKEIGAPIEHNLLQDMEGLWCGLAKT
jgi:hypothetical protein